ncbi:hypothetical protein MMF93_01100 [Streptomyces tubbatahanensis]|uniref:Uncharacterized protein n=1 Tax=Streptomyces tubbatahanensis TaxID=2923272 RepID=A0ABY3XLD1_9ACTN|nr:hypothetical protein [Streptomyces tubbatahanensis]UNS95210.1 hypothetical protein MMF93_01100 [Streptomyces tubbatahanensis]
MGWKEDVKVLREAIDELGKGVGSGLTELREQNQEMRGLLGQAHADLVTVRREVEQSRDAVAALRAELAERPRPDRTTVARGQGEEAGEQDREELLGLAAGVARAELVCHRDTWAFVVERASRGEHFRLPTDISEQPDGTVEVDVSGRSLLAAVDELWAVRREPGASVGTQRMAALAYQRIGEALRETGQAADAGADERQVTRIVIDDRPSGGEA